MSIAKIYILVSFWYIGLYWFDNILFKLVFGILTLVLFFIVNFINFYLLKVITLIVYTYFFIFVNICALIISCFAIFMLPFGNLLSSQYIFSSRIYFNNFSYTKMMVKPHNPMEVYDDQSLVYNSLFRVSQRYSTLIRVYNKRYRHQRSRFYSRLIDGTETNNFPVYWFRISDTHGLWYKRTEREAKQEYEAMRRYELYEIPMTPAHYRRCFRDTYNAFYFLDILEASPAYDFQESGLRKTEFQRFNRCVDPLTTKIIPGHDSVFIIDLFNFLFLQFKTYLNFEIISFFNFFKSITFPVIFESVNFFFTQFFFFNVCFVVISIITWFFFRFLYKDLCLFCSWVKLYVNFSKKYIVFHILYFFAFNFFNFILSCIEKGNHYINSLEFSRFKKFITILPDFINIQLFDQFKKLPYERSKLFSQRNVFSTATYNPLITTYPGFESWDSLDYMLNPIEFNLYYSNHPFTFETIPSPSIFRARPDPSKFKNRLNFFILNEYSFPFTYFEENFTHVSSYVNKYIYIIAYSFLFPILFFVEFVRFISIQFFFKIFYSPSYINNTYRYFKLQICSYFILLVNFMIYTMYTFKYFFSIFFKIIWFLWFTNMRYRIYKVIKKFNNFFIALSLYFMAFKNYIRNIFRLCHFYWIYMCLYLKIYKYIFYILISFLSFIFLASNKFFGKMFLSLYIEIIFFISDCSKFFYNIFGTVDGTLAWIKYLDISNNDYFPIYILLISSVFFILFTKIFKVGKPVWIHFEKKFITYKNTVGTMVMLILKKRFFRLMYGPPCDNSFWPSPYFRRQTRYFFRYLSFFSTLGSYEATDIDQHPDFGADPDVIEERHEIQEFELPVDEELYTDEIGYEAEIENYPHLFFTPHRKIPKWGRSWFPPILHHIPIIKEFEIRYPFGYTEAEIFVILSKFIYEATTLLEEQEFGRPLYADFYEEVKLSAFHGKHYNSAIHFDKLLRFKSTNFSQNRQIKPFFVGSEINNFNFFLDKALFPKLNFISISGSDYLFKFLVNSIPTFNLTNFYYHLTNIRNFNIYDYFTFFSNIDFSKLKNNNNKVDQSFFNFGVYNFAYENSIFVSNSNYQILAYKNSSMSFLFDKFTVHKNLQKVCNINLATKLKNDYFHDSQAYITSEFEASNYFSEYFYNSFRFRTAKQFEIFSFSTNNYSFNFKNSVSLMCTVERDFVVGSGFSHGLYLFYLDLYGIPDWNVWFISENFFVDELFYINAEIINSKTMRRFGYYEDDEIGNSWYFQIYAVTETGNYPWKEHMYAAWLDFKEVVQTYLFIDK